MRLRCYLSLILYPSALGIIEPGGSQSQRSA